MHARVVHFRTKAGKLPELVRLFHEDLVTSLEQDPGFRSAFILTDAPADRGIGFALYDREDQVRASESRFRERARRAAPLLEGEPSAEIYELSIQI